MSLAGFALGIGKIFANAVVEELTEKLEAIIERGLTRRDDFQKRDLETALLLEEAKAAKTMEEKDALLDKIYANRPDFRT